MNHILLPKSREQAESKKFSANMCHMHSFYIFKKSLLNPYSVFRKHRIVVNTRVSGR